MLKYSTNTKYVARRFITHSLIGLIIVFTVLLSTLFGRENTGAVNNFWYFYFSVFLYIFFVTFLKQRFNFVKKNAFLIINDKEIILLGMYFGKKTLNISDIESVDYWMHKEASNFVHIGFRGGKAIGLGSTAFQNIDNYRDCVETLKEKLYRNLEKENRKTHDSIIEKSKKSRQILQKILIPPLLAVFALINLPELNSSFLEYLLVHFSNNGRIFESFEYYRVFTSSLIHFNTLHFIVNFAALIGLCEMVERLIGWRRTASVFLFTTFIAVMTSDFFITKGFYGVGASGGIFGLFSFYLCLRYKLDSILPISFKLNTKKALLVMVAISIGLNIVFREYLDVVNHIGGVIGGILYFAIFMSPQKGSDALNIGRNEKVFSNTLLFFFLTSLVYFSINILTYFINT
ncbi:MAG: membrane associated rhomboid family serine protease [Gammaproteobacteria bacterium]|jgi:membrane associated rhomboid family serine protease